MSDENLAVMKRYAVASIKHGTILLVSPDRGYAEEYCDKQNELFDCVAFCVTDYNEPVKPRRPNSSSLINDVYHSDKQNGISNWPLPQEKVIVRNESLTTKQKVAAYLAKKVLTSSKA